MRFRFAYVFWLLVFCWFGTLFAAGPQRHVDLGVDVFFKDGYAQKLKGKRVGLITNHTGINANFHTTYELFLHNQAGFTLVAVFAPEHGFMGQAYAFENCKTETARHPIPIYSLFGKTRRPTPEMLKGIDVLVYDIQDIGCRSYTYATTLFYVMEEAAKNKIPVVILDRPNPISGSIVDGPMLEEKWRSFIGYLNVPYCHGMTIGELAQFFNAEYKIGCTLRVVPMKGWKREMFFSDTKLAWIPTSPQIPESDTPLFYATTGAIGELSMVSTGVGYTLPFKLIGAPWIKGKDLAQKLNAQNMPGVMFIPFYYKPQYGLYKGQNCEGVLITITNRSLYKPVKVQHLLLGVLKSMYPKIVEQKLAELPAAKKKLFCLACGTEEIFSIVKNEKYATWKLFQCHREEKELFLQKRKKYLLYN
jgi:uncharacterized protein YbbC (DUF1343 family)